MSRLARGGIARPRRGWSRLEMLELHQDLFDSMRDDQLEDAFEILAVLYGERLFVSLEEIDEITEVALRLVA